MSRQTCLTQTHTQKFKGNDGGGSVDVERFSYQRLIVGILHQQKRTKQSRESSLGTKDFQKRNYECKN